MCSSVVGYSRRALEDHRARHVDEALHVVVERRAHDAVVERVVDLGQRVRAACGSSDAADDRGEVDDVRAARASPRAPRRGRAGRPCGPRSPRASTAAPRAGRRRGPRRRGSRSRRRTTAAPIVPAPPVTRTRFMAATRPVPASAAARRRSAKTWAAPKQFHGSTTSASRRAPLGDRAQRRRGVQNSEWLVATTTASASSDRVARATASASRTCGSWIATSASSRSSSRIELVRQRVALVVGVGLEGEPEHGDLAARQRAEAALEALRRGRAARDSLTRETASSMPGRVASAPRRRRSPCAGRCRR